MRHFSEAEFVDLIEGRLPAIRAEHADECDECRALADALGAARSRASAGARSAARSSSAPASSSAVR